MGINSTFLFLSLLAGAAVAPAAPAGPRKADANKAFPQVDKNHVRKTSGSYLSAFRRIRWHYDFETAAALARDTRRPMFVIFCRAGSITDPTSCKPKCAS